MCPKPVSIEIGVVMNHDRNRGFREQDVGHILSPIGKSAALRSLRMSLGHESSCRVWVTRYLEKTDQALGLGAWIAIVA